MNSIKHVFTHGILSVFGIALLTACGGEGDGSSPPPPPPVAPVNAATAVLTFESIKTFRFSWTDVSDATHYKLLENADNYSGFSQVGGDIPRGLQSVDHVVPLYARLNAQYLLRSCNASGCTNSSVVSVSGTMVDSIGYVKASNTDSVDIFGLSVALSADGNTLAVGAVGEDGDGMDASNNSKLNSGAVYVYRRDEFGEWSDVFYIKASSVAEYIDAGDAFGSAVALSADGNTLAVGARGEGSSAPCIGDCQASNSATGAGAVYVFSRDSTGGWGDTPSFIKAGIARAMIALALQSRSLRTAIPWQWGLASKTAAPRISMAMKPMSQRPDPALFMCSTAAAIVGLSNRM